MSKKDLKQVTNLQDDLADYLLSTQSQPVFGKKWLSSVEEEQIEEIRNPSAKKSDSQGERQAPTPLDLIDRAKERHKQYMEKLHNQNLDKQSDVPTSLYDNDTVISTGGIRSGLSTHASYYQPIDKEEFNSAVEEIAAMKFSKKAPMYKYSMGSDVFIPSDENAPPIDLNEELQEYVLVRWPRSGSLMNKPFFRECVLISDKLQSVKLGSGSYFVPKKYMDKI